MGVFLNLGNGVFASQMTLSTGDSSRPVSVGLGYFNNDTHLDIAVTNYDTHTIGIFRGYGNGTFTNQTVFSTGASRPVSIAVDDFNNDHWLDIVVTNNGTNTIGIFLGYGNGSFGSQILYSTGYDSFPYCVVVGDLNNDHSLDILVANYGTDNVGMFLGNGTGNFTAQTTYSTSLGSKPYSIAVSDFNNDGHFDIAVVNSGKNNIGIFLGYGNGSFASQTTYSTSPGTNPHSIIIGDFNQDYQLDIAVSNYDTNNISVLIGNNDGSFAAPTLHSTGIDSGPFGMTAGDFDNNNQSDIAVVNSGTNNVFVLIGYSMMQSQSPTTYLTGDASHPLQIGIGDFDNDTQLDLAVLNYGTNNVGILLGYGNGSFQEQITFSTGNNSHSYAFVVGDIDNDHRLDVVVGNSNIESLGFLYGYGNGTFAAVVPYFTGALSYPRWVIVNDFNNDGYPDIGFADYGTGNMGIILGYGNRVFGNLKTYSIGDNTRPIAIAAGDFNNDHRLDIALVTISTNTLGIFLGSGDGTFILFTTYSTGDSSSPTMVNVADLNKDNHLDVVVVNQGINTIGVFFGIGDGSFGTQQSYSTGSSSQPVYVDIADLNNDGWLDLAVGNVNSWSIGVLLGHRYGYFGSQATYQLAPTQLQVQLELVILIKIID